MPLRYPGPRWTLLYGSYQGVEEFAVSELQRMVQRCLPYVLEALPAGETPERLAQPDSRRYGGRQPAYRRTRPPRARETADTPPRLLHRLLELALAAQCKVDRDRGNRRRRRALWRGRVQQKAGGAVHSRFEPGELRASFDNLPAFSLSDAPVIENRGIWSWGYVIYDYRRFFDNMARLKMNRLTVWNDRPPINCRQFIDYAHSRGVRVILGYSWGYALSKLDPTDPQHLRLIKGEVLKNYETEYRDLGMDGIYFQTFTEQSNTMIGGKSIAALACDWVNDIGRTLLERHPNRGSNGDCTPAPSKGTTST